MYNIYSLENGLRVVTEKTDYVNSVCIGVWLKSGARYEPDHLNGISHFIEHMFFKGTEKKSSIDIVRNIEEVGGYINAFTGKESSCFYIKILNNHLKVAVDTLGDMILNSKLQEKDIEKEKLVISEEINMSDDSPEDCLSDLYNKATYGDGSLANTILGSKENINSFTREILSDYIRENFTPDKCVISICGNFDDEIYKYIEDNFASWEKRESRTLDLSEQAKCRDNLFMVKDIEQVHMNITLEGAPAFSRENYPLMLLANKLGGGASSILFQKIREERGLCYSVGAFLNAHMNTGTLNIYGALTPRTAQEFVDITREELEAFSNFRFNDDELYKAKEQLKCSYIMGLESINSRMLYNGKSLLMNDRVKTPDDIITSIESINFDELGEIRKKVFKDGILNYSFVGSGYENLNIPDLKIIK